MSEFDRPAIRRFRVSSNVTEDGIVFVAIDLRESDLDLSYLPFDGSVHRSYTCLDCGINPSPLGCTHGMRMTLNCFEQDQVHCRELTYQSMPGCALFHNIVQQLFYLLDEYDLRGRADPDYDTVYIVDRTLSILIAPTSSLADLSLLNGFINELEGEVSHHVALFG